MIVVRAVLIDKNEPINVKVDPSNYIVIRELLLKEKNKIITRLKTYKNAGLIGSISFPRNKIMQKELDDLVFKKRLIKDSIEKINKIFN